MKRPSASRRRSIAVALAFLALAGCNGTPAWRGTAEQEIRLYQETYKDVARYYIEPMTPEALAMSGLRSLTAVDAEVSVAREGDAVVLRYAGDAARFAAPAPNDANGWAAVTAAATAAARAQSPALAAFSAERMEQTVIDGSLRALDRFSHYSAPEVARERRAARDGFGGIGVSLDQEDADARVVEVLPDTPAAEAGIQVDDRILAIDGVETAMLSRDEIVHRLRGPSDSVIELSIRRAGVPGPLSFSVRRARIVPPSVTLTEENGVARLRVAGFNQQTAQSLGALLRQAHRDMGAKLRGIILDLRGNPGGLLDQSIDVSSLFLDGVPISSTVGRVAESIQFFSAPHHEAERLPMVVLINGGSASAAEIVAAALQDNGRAVVVGSASYGKGTVQNVQPMPNDGELTITWARLITPAGYVLHQHGVVPTICTARLPDNAAGLGAALAHGIGISSAELRQPRATLDEAGWQRLRDACPGQQEDHAIELEAAYRLLADRALYARALHHAPAAAAHTIAAANR